MLEQILDFIHNYFVKEIYRGSFKIESKILNVDFLKEGQYFKIIGSVFNDGVHLYSANLELVDEEFKGEVWAMAVPPAVIQLSNDINAYVEEYSEKLNSPYQSESFGGYSYSKASGTDSHGNELSSWQSKFASRLNHWRKIS